MGPAKLKKAEKLGIRILSEEEFIRMIDGGAPEDAAKAVETSTWAEAAEAGIPADAAADEGAAPRTETTQSGNDTPEPRQGKLF